MAQDENKRNLAIDFLITWVDDSDQEWRRQKEAYSGKTLYQSDSSNRRYRDWDLLRYLFRSIETFAPWVNRVFFVTCGQAPSWLNKEAEKLVLVNHDDYIPKEWLPTFSSRPIENNVYRIKELSEHFVLFNDDMFITQKLDPSFFFKDGLPVLTPELHPILPRAQAGVMAHTYMNNISAINRHFNYRLSLKNAKGKWFNPFKIGLKATLENIYCYNFDELPGIRPVHVPVPLLKSTLEKVWEAEPELLEKTSEHRFRSSEDVSQYIFWIWQLMSGDFYPRAAKKTGKVYVIKEDTSVIEETIRKQKYPLFCPNDLGGFDDRESFNTARTNIQRSFDAILPNKSSFEV